MKGKVAALLFAAAMVAAPLLSAEGNPADATDMQALRAAVRADKKSYVTTMLGLTEAEAKKFWPLYDAYQREVDLANRQRSRAVEQLVGFDRPLSDAFGRQLAKDLTAADEVELKARRSVQNKLMRALPPKKVARYLQLEAKIRAVQSYDIAATIPLAK
jgi:Spy/CpxP family protein refolding chaperone